jgi:hypothetical protein
VATATKTAGSRRPRAARGHHISGQYRGPVLEQPLGLDVVSRSGHRVASCCRSIGRQPGRAGLPSRRPISLAQMASDAAKGELTGAAGCRPAPWSDPRSRRGDGSPAGPWSARDRRGVGSYCYALAAAPSAEVPAACAAAWHDQHLHRSACRLDWSASDRESPCATDLSGTQRAPRPASRPPGSRRGPPYCAMVRTPVGGIESIRRAARTFRSVEIYTGVFHEPLCI